MHFLRKASRAPPCSRCCVLEELRNLPSLACLLPHVGCREDEPRPNQPATIANIATAAGALIELSIVISTPVVIVAPAIFGGWGATSGVTGAWRCPLRRACSEKEGAATVVPPANATIKRDPGRVSRL